MYINWMNAGAKIGYFFVMGIFMFLAFLTAKRKICWLLYTIGALLQFVSLAGASGSYTFRLPKATIIEYWIIYIFLLIFFAILIHHRKAVLLRKTEEEIVAKINCENDSSKATGWICSCGRKNADYVSSCTCGIRKRDIQKESNHQ